MSRTLTDLVTELGQAAQICSGFAVRTTAHTAADALTQVYEAALRGLHQLQVERRKLELERQQAAAREQSIVDDQARNASIIKLNVVRAFLLLLLFSSSSSFSCLARLSVGWCAVRDDAVHAVSAGLLL